MAGTNGGQTEQIIFLYKLRPGMCPKSYGANVARLAGLPGVLVDRANYIADKQEKRNKQDIIELKNINKSFVIEDKQAFDIFSTVLRSYKKF